jgi:hypothetical protein
VRRRRRDREPPPEWALVFDPDEWITTEDLETQPRYPAGAPMSVEEAARRRWSAASREWWNRQSDYDLAEYLQMMRGARRAAGGMPPDRASG